nr:aspartate/glutamate racemase family protein [uncultured Cetobacterium sp.]
MKKIGLIGGMSWESTVTYYKVINETIKQKLGGLHSGKIVLESVDFQEIEKYQSNGEWDKSARVLIEAARNLEKAGAGFIIICTNTMHKIASEIQKEIDIPIIHIAEATGERIIDSDIKKVILLGTKYTMTENFYKDKLISNNIEVVIPDKSDIEKVNSIIYNELCLGSIKPESKYIFLNIIDKLKNSGAQGVILGCTEIGLLINSKDLDIPVFDTTLIHAEKAALLSIKN